jgi:HPt (histidine-containing phosphotransfer) domain-containing protein
MDDDLLAKFLPQFLTLARSRVEAAITGATTRQVTTKIIRELHTLAGEAGLLGLRDVVPLARDCDQKARLLQSSHAEADAEILVAALRQLERVIEGIATASPQTGSS